MGELGQVIDAYIDNVGYRVSDRAIGARVGVTGQTIGNWRKGLAFPSQANLKALAALMGPAVINAALRDAGYLPAAPISAETAKDIAVVRSGDLKAAAKADLIAGIAADAAAKPAPAGTKRTRKHG